MGSLIVTIPVTDTRGRLRRILTNRGLGDPGVTFITQNPVKPEKEKKPSVAPDHSAEELKKPSQCPSKRSLAPEVKEHFEEINTIINKLLDTSAVDKMRDFRNEQNYLYSDDMEHLMDKFTLNRYRPQLVAAPTTGAPAISKARQKASQSYA